MIEGVTKQFEQDGSSPISLDERRAATAQYLSGLKDVFERFDPYTGGSEALALDAIPEGEELPILFTLNKSPEAVVGIAQGQRHVWSIDEDGLVKRSDSGILRKQKPQEASDIILDDASEKLLAALMSLDITDEEGVHGIEYSWVDTEEIRNLFTLLGHATLSEDI